MCSAAHEDLTNGGAPADDSAIRDGPGDGAIARDDPAGDAQRRVIDKVAAIKNKPAASLGENAAQNAQCSGIQLDPARIVKRRFETGGRGRSGQPEQARQPRTLRSDFKSANLARPLT